MNRRSAAKGFLSGVSVAAMLISSQFAGAAPVSCPGTPSAADREFTLVTNPESICLDSGTGNINGNPMQDPFLMSAAGAGYVTLDKTDDATTGAAEGALIFTPPTSGLSGMFSLDTVALSGYTDFVLALKSGQGQLDPDWAVFLLNGATSGEWSISGNQALSHANLYAKVIPVPAAAWLFGSALLGLAGIGRKRRAV